MKKATRIILIIVVAILIVLVLIISGLLALKLFFVGYLKDTTEDTMNFLQECPLPPELGFKYENISEIAVAQKSPNPEETKAMVAWCCKNYDSSRKICQLMSAQNN